MIKIGQQAPYFSCQAVVNKEITTISLEKLPHDYKILFFYPLDFTFVCPTELHALQKKLSDFNIRNTAILAISVDSVYSHLAWLNTPKNQGGIESITYPILSDITKTIAQDYNVLDQNSGIALRGTFIIDKNNIIQYASTNNLPIGRNIDELIRIIDAIKHVENFGQVCPANWNIGQKSMKASQEGLREFFN